MLSKALVFAVIVLFIGAGVVPSLADKTEKSNIQVDCFNDDVDQNQTDQDSLGIVCSWYIWAQSFVPSKEMLTGVQLLLQRHGFIRSDLKVSIKNDLYGEDLTTLSIPYDNVPKVKFPYYLWSSNFDWISFDFPDISVSPGETYYITLYTDRGLGVRLASLSSYGWGNSHNPDSYLNGESWFSNVQGNTPTPWKIWDSPFDFCFKTLYTEI